MIECVKNTPSLADLEAKIERGLDAWIEAALAWEEIRRERRYLDSGYSDFDTYTRERWGKRRETIDQMIRSAQVVSQLNAIALTALPTNESQARELARIPQSERADVWQRVTEQHGERVTAQHIRQAIQPDPPLLSIVDLETGEVVEPESNGIHSEESPLYDVTESAYRVANGAGKANLDRLNYLAALTRTLSQVTALLTYDPERVAEVIDPEFKRLQIDVVAERISDWAHRVDAAMPTALRMVKGGKS